MLTTRIMTAAVLLAGALVTVLWLPSWLMAALFGALWTIGASEWAKLIGWRDDLMKWVYPLVFVLLMLASGGWFDTVGATRVTVATAGWWLLAFGGVLAYPWRIPALAAAAAGLLALGPSWFVLAYLHQAGADGPALVLSVLCIVWAADVAAYFCGRRFGRVKLAPRVSPGKTWEGVIGGLGAATFAAILGGLWFGDSLLVWAGVGFAAALASIVGDLTVSALKRRARVKDSGSLLPGHGGVLDRIDSLTAAVPVFYLALHLAGLVG